MLVVMDANVIVSALYSRRGASHLLLRAAIGGSLPYAISPLLALEYEGIISQKIQEGLLRMAVSEARKVMDALCAYATLVWNPIQMRPVLPDPSDDKVLECAISAPYSHILTFNQGHFSATLLAPYRMVAMTPGEFLKEWRSNP